VFSRKITIHLFNLGHEICVEARNFDSGLSEAQLTSAANTIVWIQNTDDHSFDPSFDDAVSASDLRRVSRSTRLQSGEEGRPR
jgi:hypothetical protein